MAKQGKKSLAELAAEVETQAKQRFDLVAETPDIRMDHDDAGLFLEVNDLERPRIEARDMSRHAHSQIAARLGVPKKYYDRLREKHPDILMANVNGLFEAEPEKRMLRMTGSDMGSMRLRAFMSDRYRRIDNYELMRHAILPTLLEDPKLRDDISVVSCEVTESKLYIKCISRSVTSRLGIAEENDLANAGFVITNSEIGMGALSISQYIYRQVCENGMMGNKLFNKYHVGRNVDTSFEQYMANDTLKVDDQAIMLKARDMISAAIDVDQFEEATRVMRNTSMIEVENPRAAVEVLTNSFSLNQDASDSILKRFFQNESRDGNTMFNMVNAITNSAEDMDSYDKATEMESLGHQVMNLGVDTISQIAIAGAA